MRVSVMYQGPYRVLGLTWQAALLILQAVALILQRFLGFCKQRF